MVAEFPATDETSEVLARIPAKAARFGEGDRLYGVGLCKDVEVLQKGLNKVVSTD